MFNEKEEVLLIRSKRYTVMRLEWEIPAGRMEDRESKEEAARRECLEEMDARLRICPFYALITRRMECPMGYAMCLLQELIRSPWTLMRMR